MDTARRKELNPTSATTFASHAPDEDFRHGILHWVVVTGYDNDAIINDPDIGSKLKVPANDFSRALDL